jgi:hypothetical protein
MKKIILIAGLLLVAFGCSKKVVTMDDIYDACMKLGYTYRTRPNENLEDVLSARLTLIELDKKAGIKHKNPNDPSTILMITHDKTLSLILMRMGVPFLKSFDTSCVEQLSDEYIYNK